MGIPGDMPPGEGDIPPGVGVAAPPPGESDVPGVVLINGVTTVPVPPLLGAEVPAVIGGGGTIVLELMVQAMMPPANTTAPTARPMAVG